MGILLSKDIVLRCNTVLNAGLGAFALHPETNFPTVDNAVQIHEKAIARIVIFQFDWNNSHEQ